MSSSNFLPEEMQENDVDITVVDVYDMASEIGKEFERIIEAHGTDALTNLIPKVIEALERLENLALRNETENTTVQDLLARIRKLEAEKVEKAEDRKKFETVSTHLMKSIVTFHN